MSFILLKQNHEEESEKKWKVKNGEAIKAPHIFHVVKIQLNFTGERIDALQKSIFRIPWE